MATKKKTKKKAARKRAATASVKVTETVATNLQLTTSTGQTWGLLLGANFDGFDDYDGEGDDRYDDSMMTFTLPCGDQHSFTKQEIKEVAEVLANYL